MLVKAKEQGFRFDTVQMPLNVMDAHFRSFQAHVLPVLVKEKIGVLGMKSKRGAASSKARLPDRMFALRPKSADLGCDHGHRQHENSGPGIRGRAHVYAAVPAANRGAACQNFKGRAKRRIRVVQNHVSL